MGAGVILDARAVVVAAPLRFPTILRFGQGEPEPVDPPAVTVTIHRQPLSVAAPVQSATLELWRGQQHLSPELQRRLAADGLLAHCGFLSSQAGAGPLHFRRLAHATVRVFGTAWAREQIGRPSETDPYSEYGQQIGREYAEAIEGGEPVYNQLVIHGLPRPVVYSHLLVGWTSPSGRRALLTVIDHPEA